MRFLTSMLCLVAVSAPLTAAEIVRWVDKDGVVHFSDRPQDAAQAGAEKVQIIEAPKPGSVPPPPTGAVSGPPKPFRYAACEITSPNPDQVFQNVRSVSVSVGIQPSLQLDHTIVVRLNGTRVQNWPAAATSYVLNDLPRGSYGLSVQVVDQRGATVCSGATSTFHIRQPSLLTPGAKGAR